MPFSFVLLEPIGEINPATINKPTGGLWASPYYTDEGWYDNNPDILRGEYYPFEFKIPLEGRYFVDNAGDLAALIDRFPGEDTLPYPTIDWVLLSKYFDTFHITMNGIQASYHFSTFYFYGWDCETVLVFNRNAILTWNP